MTVDKRTSAQVKPVPGQSHWCEGLSDTCAQVVKNSTVFCEAGHENDIVTSVASGANASLEASLSSLGIEETEKPNICGLPCEDGTCSRRKGHHNRGKKIYPGKSTCISDPYLAGRLDGWIEGMIEGMDDGGWA